MTSLKAQKTQIKLTDVIAPSFYSLHWDVIEGRHTYYKLAGGRGSTKSSFASVEIILGMMDDANKGIYSNAIAYRRYQINLYDSVYEQLVWAVDKLGVSHKWHKTKSPMRLTYTPTGQVILFRGADKVIKSKSIKVSKGYIKYLWFEELDEFEGPEKIRSIQQSVIRGGEKFTVFYSYNPPKSQRSWVNDPIQWDKPDTISHYSNYLSVPRHWLGEQFIADAEHLKATKPEAYRHEYLGEVTGTGAEVFRNLTNRRITEDEIRSFDHIRRGIDWGYASDPFHYVECHYDKTRKRLFIYREIHQVRLSNRAAALQVKALNPLNGEIICDSAEPKSIADFQEYGLRVRGARKGPDSVEYGIKWLSEELEEIIIDAERCPNTWREFYGYELERDENGNFKAGYPDKDCHSIDAVRYALEDDMKRGGSKFVNVWI
ncbi:MAG TPA: PBSX family phage terminase large subunit [Clostridia bacterium]|nr:PBSX family phage terminase large subunit [Clostridia bacterium]